MRLGRPDCSFLIPSLFRAKKFFKETRIEIQGRRRTLMSLVEPGCFIVRPGEEPNSRFHHIVELIIGDKRKHFKEIKRQTLMDYKDMVSDDLIF